LGRRPALPKPSENHILEFDITQQSTAFPAPAVGLLLGVGRLVADLGAAVAHKLTAYGRWRAIHSCRDLADCFPGLAESGKRTALFKRKLFIALSYCNTLSKKCCTWFVNLGHPGSFHSGKGKDWIPAFAGMTGREVYFQSTLLEPPRL
jgi:hypothetical protein